MEGSERLPEHLGEVGAAFRPHLTAFEIEGALQVADQVWSESGANFAEVLKQALGTFHVN